MSGQQIAKNAVKLAKNVPLPIILRMAEAIRDCDLQHWGAARAQIVSLISQPVYRSMATQFLDDWHMQAPEASSESVSLALLTAAYSEEGAHIAQGAELVWTGPDVGFTPLRQTEQALLQLIDSAQRRILIVSYAVYHIPRICEALLNAAHRGVCITIIIETPDRLEGQNTYSTLRALSPEVVAHCQLFYWPLEKRELDAKRKPGILHVKCAVVDGERMFLSSANLTEYAFTLNMELGILLRGGPLPQQVENHFVRMTELGIFIEIGGHQ